MQRLIAVGRIGKDVEFRRLESGVAVAKCSLAVSERYKDANGQRQEHTEWFDIVFWRGLAEVAEKYLKKGDLISIEAKKRSRSYEKGGQMIIQRTSSRRRHFHKFLNKSAVQTFLLPYKSKDNDEKERESVALWR